jgi:hypothetical protein
MLPGVIRFLSLRPWDETYLALAPVPKPVQTREAVPGEAVSVDSTSFRLALSDFGFFCRHCRGGGYLGGGRRASLATLLAGDVASLLLSRVE